jgi:hypothetical protein
MHSTMRKTILSTAVIILLLPMLLAGSVSAGAADPPDADITPLKSPDFFYPDPILQQLGIVPTDIIENQSKFKNDPTHVEWMHHTHDALPEINREKQEAIADIHTALLFMKARLDDGYFKGKIHQPEYATQLTGLMQWFQAANRAVLTSEEHQRLFGLPAGENDPSHALGAGGELEFPIKNPNTTPEMIKTLLDAPTIQKLNRFYHMQSQELKDISEIYKAGDFQKAGKDQIKKDMARIEQELETAFLKYCREILTDEEFYLLYGSRKNN